ncbi:hypothetical protein ACLKA6_019351 [Drosophila palustris]
MDTKSNDDSGGSDSLDKSMQRKCVMVETTSVTSEPAAEAETEDNSSRDSAALQEQPPGEPMSDACGAGESSTDACKIPTTNSINNNTTAASAAFETKVKLISQNLKETKLAETEVTESNISNDAEEDPNSTDDCDSRVKKVRFHPDVKENDGGSNRVKKKWKSSQNHGGDGPNLGCDGMDMDEDEQVDADEEEEDEEEFNLDKTIAEAEDYLKQHPLTFVRRIEENGERSRGGLLNIEDIPQMMVDEDVEADDDDSDANFYKKCKPENGIERVLGKETKAGKVEFLLRYENQGGLFWESEEYIRRMCPTLLKVYEKNRERRQQRLMHHVAKRQSLRQRYTDF